MLDGDVVEAIRGWIDRDSHRRGLELFFTLVDSSREEGPCMVFSPNCQGTGPTSPATLSGVSDGGTPSF
jgi:hypothetical protein